MNLSEKTKQRIFFSCLALGGIAFVTIAGILASVIPEIISQIYNQVVTDFGNPR